MKRKLKIHYAFLGGWPFWKKKQFHSVSIQKNMSWSWTCLDLNQKKTGKILWWWCIHPFRIKPNQRDVQLFLAETSRSRSQQSKEFTHHPSLQENIKAMDSFSREFQSMTIYKQKIAGFIKTCYLLFTSYDFYDYQNQNKSKRTAYDFLMCCWLREVSKIHIHLCSILLLMLFPTVPL